MAMNDDKKLRDTYLKQYSDGIEETRLSCSKAANAEFLVTLYCSLVISLSYINLTKNCPI